MVVISFIILGVIKVGYCALGTNSAAMVGQIAALIFKSVSSLCHCQTKRDDTQLWKLIRARHLPF